MVEFSKSSPNTGGFSAKNMNLRSFGNITLGRNHNDNYLQNSKMQEYNEDLIRHLMMPESAKSKSKKERTTGKLQKKSSNFKKKSQRKSSRRKLETEQKL